MPAINLTPCRRVSPYGRVDEEVHAGLGEVLGGAALKMRGSSCNSWAATASFDQPSGTALRREPDADCALSCPDSGLPWRARTLPGESSSDPRLAGGSYNEHPLVCSFHKVPARDVHSVMKQRRAATAPPRCQATSTRAEPVRVPTAARLDPLLQHVAWHCKGLMARGPSLRLAQELASFASYAVRRFIGQSWTAVDRLMKIERQPRARGALVVPLLARARACATQLCSRVPLWH